MFNRSFRFGFAVVPLLLASCAFAFAAEGSFDRTLQVSGSVNLQIESGSGSIHVRTGASNEVRSKSIWRVIHCVPSER